MGDPVVDDLYMRDRDESQSPMPLAEAPHTSAHVTPRCGHCTNPRTHMAEYGMRNDSGLGGASDTRETGVPPLHTPYFGLFFAWWNAVKTLYFQWFMRVLESVNNVAIT